MITDMPGRFVTQDRPDAKSGIIRGLSYAGLTDPGRRRQDNQDAFAFANKEYAVNPDKGFLMAVADGMGGHRGGAVASRLALGVLLSEYYKLAPRDIVSALRLAVAKANEAVYTLAHDDDNYDHMGTTLTVAVLKDSALYFAHVGDSRGYLIVRRNIEQFTSDHSYVASLVRAGAITESEAVNHPSDNIILRAVGIKNVVEADVSEKKRLLKKGWHVLLCSDGLFKVVPDQEIREIVRTWIAPDLICKKLIEMANDRGGPDNVTVAVARIEKDPSFLKKAAHLLKLGQ